MNNIQLNSEIFIEDNDIKNKLEQLFKKMNNYSMHNFTRLNNIVSNSEKSLNILNKINDDIKENDEKISSLISLKQNLKLKLKNKQKELCFSLNKKNLDL